MDVVASFLLATSFAYLASAVYSILGKPALIGPNRSVQMVSYLVIGGILFYVVLFPSNSVLKIALGIIYSFAAVSSFIGFPQRWAAYWKSAPGRGSDAGQIGMAFWDLALAVVFFYLI